MVNRVVALANRLYDGRIEVTPEGKVLGRIKRAKDQVDREIGRGSLALALRRIADLAVFGNQYFQEERPWEGGKPEVIAGGLQLIKAVAILLEPFVPQFSPGVYRLLNLQDPSFASVLQVEPFRVRPAEPLLQKIDIDEIERRYAELKGRASTEAQQLRV